MALFVWVNNTNSQKDKSLIADETDVLDSSLSTTPLTPERIKEIIGGYSLKYGKVMIELATCESGVRDICIMDTNNKLSCGIFMFQKSTFLHYCPDLKWHNSIKDDIVCAERVIRQIGIENDWKTCSKRIK